MRLYVDMDGTIARFYEKADCVHKCCTPGYFTELRPYDGLLAATALLCEREDLTVRILSAAAPGHDHIIREKESWVYREFSRHTQKIPRVIIALGKSKAEAAEELDGPLDKNSWLIDDYSKNLMDWVISGGRGIKAINEVNGFGWNGYNWSGHRIENDWPAELLYRTILDMMTSKK